MTRFGVGGISCQRVPGDRRTDAQLYAEALELAGYAEELGFDSVVGQVEIDPGGAASGRYSPGYGVGGAPTIRTSESWSPSFTNWIGVPTTTTTTDPTLPDHRGALRPEHRTRTAPQPGCQTLPADRSTL